MRIQDGVAQSLHDNEALKARLRRAKPSAQAQQTPRGLLDPPPKKKCGRPAGCEAKDLALAAIAMKARLAEATPARSLTQEQAINAVRVAQGHRSRSPKENRADTTAGVDIGAVVLCCARVSRKLPEKAHRSANALVTLAPQTGGSMGASRVKVITALLLGTSSAIAAEPPLQETPGEAAMHLIGRQPMLRVPWQDLTLEGEDGFGGWRFRVTVDAQGRVAQAVLAAGPAEYRAQAEATVRGLKFKPFQRDGKAVAVQLEQWVARRVEDYTGPADRRFPVAAGVKPQDVSIALQRTGCYGSCPAYRLELRGDGLVSYRGDAFVVAQGSYQWRVAPAVVAALVERFRQADYFRLKGAYIAGVTDLPSYITRLSLGAQQKVVVDYGGGDAVPDDAAGRPGPMMPRSVTELEDAIDAAAGSASWVLGDADTMARLRAANFDFGRRGAATGVSTLMQNCQLDVAAEFLSAGKLASKEFADMDAEPDLWTAAVCGDLALVRRLESHGALARAAGARALLEAGVMHGYPELVAMALNHGAKVRGTIPNGLPLIISAAAATRPDARRSGSARYDPGQVIGLLLKAGADARAQYNEGSTALFAAGSPEAVAALVRAGLDPNATDRDGHTALESAHSQAVAQALLAAGARLPTTPQGLDVLRAKAARLGWTELRPVLDRAAAGTKR